MSATGQDEAIHGADDTATDDARSAVLGRIGKALGRTAMALDVAAIPDDIASRIDTPRRHTLPGFDDDPVDRLIAQMEGVLISVVRLQSRSDVVAAVREWLHDNEVAGEVTVAPALRDIAWPDDWRLGAASGIETTSVTSCIAAVAETGSLAFASGADTPATLNFLPENHIVLVHESQVVRHIDDVFPTLRAYTPLPRALNLVTGPSRTADIEQTLEIGAHGPRRMHVLLLPGAVPA